MKGNKKDFFLGAMVGGMIGIAAVRLVSAKGKNAAHLKDSLQHVSKVIAAAGMEGNLPEIIDWTTEGIQLWNKLNKKRRKP